MKQINLRVSEDLLARIDEARGDVSRNRWLTRAAQTQLNLGVIVPIEARDLRLQDLERGAAHLAGTPEGDRLAALAERHRSSADAKRHVAPVPKQS